MELESVKGVGPKTIKLLNKINIFRSNDLLNYYPFRYQIYKIESISKAKANEEITIKGIISSEAKVLYIKRNLNKLTFKITTENKLINVIIFNRAFMKPNITFNKSVNIIGKYNEKLNTFTATNILLENIENLKIIPVYHLVNGLHNKQLIKYIQNVFDCQKNIDFELPLYLEKSYDFIDKRLALKYIHFPNTIEEIKQAKLRLIYEELFVFMFKINYLKAKQSLTKGLNRNIDSKQITSFIKILPFLLTNDQQKAVNEIIFDLSSSKRTNRLLLGDVGSGKTIVAFIACYANYLSGYQSVIMAPTEILAKQHYENIIDLFKNLKINIKLLTGSLNKKEKDLIYEEITNNKVDIVIGTHAVISDKVLFNNLGLVITDEQHRFGVNQRCNLQNKGEMPDVIYLSATPIPRTYALTLYGDMDISIIKEKPLGRKDITTFLKKNEKIKEILAMMLEEIKNNHQIYVVAPLIDENEELNLNDVKALKNNLDKAFNNKVPIDILHGKVKPLEKEKIMNDFKNNKIKVLISTTVIEVGIDVKNATMMVIFNAERFGLATLHQLRGRVGRSDLESKCILISNSEKERLKVMTESNDGFYISQKDFELRGEGDLFGIKQSGDMTFRLASIQRDYKILLKAKEDSEKFIEENKKDNFNYPLFKEISNKLDFID